MIKSKLAMIGGSVVALLFLSVGWYIHHLRSENQQYAQKVEQMVKDTTEFGIQIRELSLRADLFQQSLDTLHQQIDSARVMDIRMNPGLATRPPDINQLKKARK